MTISDDDVLEFNRLVADRLRVIAREHKWPHADGTDYEIIANTSIQHYVAQQNNVIGALLVKLTRP